MKPLLQLGLLAFALSACSLAGDLTPPPGPIATEAPVQSIPVDQAGAVLADLGATPASQLAEQSGTIVGQVLNGTLNAGVAAGLPVTLHGFDAHSTTPDTATTFATTTTAEGAFRFDAVPFSLSRQFVVTTVYGEASYASDMLAFAPGEAVLDTTLLVYEGTTESSALRVDQVHTFIEFASPQVMTVGQLYVFSNDGNLTYGAGGQATLHFGLPAGATAISVQGAIEGENLFATDTGFDLAQPVTPGQRTAQVLLSFTLPYTGALDFEQTLAYPVESLNVLVTDLAVTVSDTSLQTLGIQDSMGMQFQNFEQTDLPAGETLRFHVSGAPAATTAGAIGTVAGAAPTTAARPWGLITGLGGLGVGLVVAGGWLYFKRASAPKLSAGREELLQALVDLDERYDSAQVSPTDYQSERERLKRQLREQWS